jgi:hypothetical protein
MKGHLCHGIQWGIMWSSPQAQATIPSCHVTHGFNMFCKKLYIGWLSSRDIFTSTLMNRILLEDRCRFPNTVYLSTFRISMKTFALMQHVRFLCVHNVCINHMSTSCVVAHCCLNITVSNSPAGGDSYLLPANLVHYQHCASFDVLAAVWLRVLFVWGVILCHRTTSSRCF